MKMYEMYERLKPKIQVGFHYLLGLVMVGLVLGITQFASATPTTTVLIADKNNHRVIEVDPNTHNIVWQYGQTGVAGSGTNYLDSPHEATSLMNGNVLIADRSNNRVIEVKPTGASGGNLIWQCSTVETLTLLHPIDIKRLNNGNVLITLPDGVIVEVQPTYPNGGSLVWKCTPASGAKFSLGVPWEAERLPDGTTLIAESGKVIRINSAGTEILWEYENLNISTDASLLPNGNILIVEFGSNRVIEVMPSGTSSGTIVWQYGGTYGSGPNQLSNPREAVRMVNGNTLIADTYNNRVIEVKTSDYPNFTAASILWQQGTGVWGSGWNQLSGHCDVEERWQGILNQMLVEYRDMAGVPQPVVTAWVFTPVILPVVTPPVLEVTKTVSPAGTQTPGTELTYTIAYTNTGAGTATDAVFTDMVPPGTVYGTSTAVIATGPTGAITYSHNGSTYDSSDSAPVTHIRWSIPAIGPGESGTLRFSVRIK